MLYDFNKTYKERVSLVLEDGRKAEGWFADGYRIDPKSLSEGQYWYQTRHGESDWATPLTIVQGGILVNFCGTFICDVDLELNEETEILRFEYLRI